MNRTWRTVVWALRLVTPLVATGVAMAGDPAPTGERASEQPAVASVAAVLSRSVDKVEWEDQPLADVIAWLREQGAVNVIVVWRAVEQAGVTEDSEISLTLSKTTVAGVLREVTDQLDEEGNVVFRAAGNVIRLATKDYFERRLATRTYEVNDLLQRTPDYAATAPQIDMTQAMQSSGQGGGRGAFTSGGTNAAQSGREGEQERTQRRAQLRELIQRTINAMAQDPEGDGMYVTEFDTVLVVRATPEIHEAIAGFCTAEP
ncbi:MAG TPA: hypothetical protein PKK06_01025 [Phycisphaerae bacterium]|nr:hypothetical protein [Phycisphaerae bacterium]HNU43810.1 hypothetical protein [Phycisphaerae bacterium]